MRIKIISFHVTEIVTLRDTWLALWSRLQAYTFWSRVWLWLITPADQDEFHFEVTMKVEYQQMSRKLMEKDFIELDNKQRLVVWSVDRMDIIRAKTYKMTREDLRKARPKEMYLIYENQHGHLNDRAS